MVDVESIIAGGDTPGHPFMVSRRDEYHVAFAHLILNWLYKSENGTNT